MLQRMYRDKLAVMRRATRKLNAAGIWPMYSIRNHFDSFDECAMPYSEAFDSLSDVGYFKFMTISPADISKVIVEVRLGLPLVLMAYLQLCPLELSLASFLIVQSNYTYFGTSKDPYWYDPDWTWHTEYNSKYGSPLGPAVNSTKGWTREFTGCSVFVGSDLKTARITMKGVSITDPFVL